MNVKIAVVGAGRVGSTAAYSLAASGLAREIVVIDTDRGRAEGEAMDIAHAVPFFAPVTVRPGALEDAAGALITVVAAGSAQREGETRPALARRNLHRFCAPSFPSWPFSIPKALSWWRRIRWMR